MAVLTTGKVLQFDEVRGYGFIQPRDGGEDVFMHANDLLDEKYLFQAGSEVEFSMEMGDRGPKASDIRLVHQPSGSGEAGYSRKAVLRPDPASRQTDDEEEPESVEEFRNELANALIDATDSLTAVQIKQVRDCVVEMALVRGWVEA